MKTLVIEIEDESDVEGTIEHVTRLIQGGFTSGYYPYWNMTDGELQSGKTALSTRTLQVIGDALEDWLERSDEEGRADIQVAIDEIDRL